MDWLRALALLSLAFKDSVSNNHHKLELSIISTTFVTLPILKFCCIVDGCPSEEIDGFKWPESDLDLLGLAISVSCTCGSLDTTMLKLQAIRNCTGSYTEGAKWMGPGNSTACQFSNAAMNLCSLYDVSCLSQGY